jgi:hypothetical protein
LRKNGAVLFFSTSANMLFAKEGDTWTALGHVLPVDTPRMSRPIPKIPGNSHAGVGVPLMGVRDQERTISAHPLSVPIPSGTTPGCGHKHSACTGHV